MQFQSAQTTEKVTLELVACLPVSSLTCTRQHIEQRVEARFETPAAEIVWTDAQVATHLTERVNQLVQPAWDVPDEPEVLAQHGFRRTGVPAPQETMDVPIEQLVTLGRVGDGPRPVARGSAPLTGNA